MAMYHDTPDCEEAQLSGFTVDGTFQEYAVSPLPASSH